MIFRSSLDVWAFKDIESFNKFTYLKSMLTDNEFSVLLTLSLNDYLIKLGYEELVIPLDEDTISPLPDVSNSNVEKDQDNDKIKELINESNKLLMEQMMSTFANLLQNNVVQVPSNSLQAPMGNVTPSSVIATKQIVEVEAKSGDDAVVVPVIKTKTSSKKKKKLNMNALSAKIGDMNT